MTSLDDRVQPDKDTLFDTSAALEHAVATLDNPSRRRALGTLCALSAFVAAGCSSESDDTGSSNEGGAGQGGAPSACVESPTEDAGPYVDKTGMLDEPEFYRTDISENKPGLSLAMTFTLVNVNANCAPLAGLAVEIWHCDAGGFYSEYTTQAGDPNDESATTFLRGLQRSDEAGKVTFETIYPGWYAGRAPHVHLIVYRDGKPLKTMQLALPDAICASVYASGVYAAKGPSPLTNTSDALFKRGDLEHELLALEGDLTRGYVTQLTLGVLG